MLCSTEMRSQKHLGPWGCALQGLRQRGNGKALPFQQKEQDRRSGQAGEGLPTVWRASLPILSSHHTVTQEEEEVRYYTHVLLS